MDKTNKTAVIIGATGLVGSELLHLLLADDQYSVVKVFHRRSTGVNNSKLEEHIINFDELEQWKKHITGDELYSALGTTIKVAGSKEAQFKIDYQYQLDVAKSAFENGIKRYGLVSSLGATQSTKNFYLNMKGQLDDDVQKISFEKLVIARPSLLVGDRKEKRLGEIVTEPLLNLATKLPALKKYKPIHAKQVAQSLINAMNSDSNQAIYEGDELFDLV